MLLKYFCILLCFLLHITNGANILFFFALSTFSHRIAVWPLVEKLAAKGHQVTFVQPFKPKKPSAYPIKEFFPKALEAAAVNFEKIDFLSLRLEKGHEGTLQIAKDLPVFGLNICKTFLADPETQSWTKTEKFDLIVIDALMNDCGFGLAHVFKAKTIIYGTSHPLGWWFDSFGLQVEASWIPDNIMPYRQPMTLYERGKTSLLHAAMYREKQSSFYPELDKVFREQFDDPKFPTVAELERKTSLIFTNTHFSEEYARSLPPFVVSVGGLHCEDGSQKLTKELETFINGSDAHGFIYISFGSAAKITNAPKEFQNIFYTALGNSKARFVWKFDGPRPKEMPINVYTNSWLPQQAIMAHPKIKAFLTHGGLLGMQEAVWQGVPLLPMPIFAEQDYNAQRVDDSERGIMLDPNSLTVSKLEDAIHRVTTDSKYKINMEKASRLFKDRPAKPVDTALFWVEYVLRHPEEDLNAALKPLSIKQTWYERRLLDVWATLFILITISLIILAKICKVVIQKYFKNSSVNKEDKLKWK